MHVRKAVGMTDMDVGIRLLQAGQSFGELALLQVGCIVKYLNGYGNVKQKY